MWDYRRPIAALGHVSGAGAEEIDAKGRIVTPGFVDLHTHYDGQATGTAGSPVLAACVTTAIMGNCGVGFAPAGRPGDLLIRLMRASRTSQYRPDRGAAVELETFPDI